MSPKQTRSISPAATFRRSVALEHETAVPPPPLRCREARLEFGRPRSEPETPQPEPPQPESPRRDLHARPLRHVGKAQSGEAVG
jgi:hypothetical protein